ncbi:MAG: NAD(P)H-dependent glycerol-3-phosphate dehydrogenase [Pseudomonadota bacterium]
MAEKVAVFGAGAWGSALACVAARSGHAVSLWGRSKETISELERNRTNSKYLDDLKLDESISVTNDLSHAIQEASILILAVPTQTLGVFLDQIRDQAGESVLLTTCKGIDRKTGKLPHEVIRASLPRNPICALSGPSFARDVVAGLPTAVTIASEEETRSIEMASKFSTNAFRCYASNDLKGVELGGALKNVLALAVGAARGMRLGASAEAALIARGFAEISRFARDLGARPETLTGLSGLGDLVLTCSSEQSRNFTYGMAMGKGNSLEGLKLAEGAFTASIASKLAKTTGTDVPITEAIVEILEKKLTAQEAMQKLLTRPLKRES